MSPIGLQNEATIKLKVDLDSSGINEVKSLLRSLTAAMNAQSFAKQMRVASQSIVMLRQELSKTKVDLRNAEKSLAAMKNAATQTATGVKKLASTQKELKGLLDRISQAEHKFDALFRAAYRLQMVGRNLKSFSDTIVGFGNDIMNTFGDFEFMMNRAAGAMQVWAGQSLVGIDDLRNGILDTAESLKLFSAEEVAQGLYFWGSATGQVVKEQEDLNVALEALIPIMQTAAMTNTGYEQTIKGVYSIITQYYNGSLEKAGDVTKTLFYITQRTAAEFTDLIQSFKMVGPVAAQIGVTFEQTAEIFGKMADLGIRGSSSGRAFRQLYIQLLKPSTLALKKYGEVFNELGGIFEGKSFYDIIFPEGQYVGIEKHIETLGKAMANLSQEEGLSFLARISTANMLPMIVALTAQWRREQMGLAEATDKFKDSETEAISYFNKNWALLSGSWNATVASLTRSMERLKITIGAELAVVLTPIIERFKEFIGRIQEVVDKNPQLVQSIGRIAAAIASVAAIAGQILIVTGSLIGLASAIGVVTYAFSPLLGAVGATVVAILSLGDAVIRNIDYIRMRLEPAVIAVVDAFQVWVDSADELFATIDRITAMLSDFADTVIRGMTEVVRSFLLGVEAVMELDASLGGQLSSTLVIIIASLALANAATAAWSIIIHSSLVGAIKNWVIGLKTAITSINLTTISVRGLGAALWSLMGGPFGLIALGAMLMMSGFRVPILSDAIDSLTGGFRDFNKELEETIGNFGELGTFKLEGMFLSSAKVAAEMPAITNTIAEMWDNGLLAGADQSVLDSVETYRDNVMKYGELIEPGLDKANAEAVDALALRLARNEGGAQDKLYAALADSMAQNWVIDSGQLNTALAAAGRETISTVDFGKAANEMMRYMDIDFFVDPNRAERLGDFVMNVMSKTPLFISSNEIGTVYERVKEEMGAGWEDMWAEFSPSEFAMLSIEKIGSTFASDFEDKALPALEAMADQVYSTTGMTAADIAALITKPIYENMSVAEIYNDPRITGAPKALAQGLYKMWEQAFARENGAEVGFSMAETVKFLKDTWTVIIDHSVMESFPDISQWTEAIGNLSFISDRNEIRQAFLDILDSGLGSALMSADLPKEFKDAILPYLEDALVLGGTPELQALVASLKADGVEVGTTISREWINGLAEGVDKGFDREALKDALNKGTGKDMVKKTIGKYASDLFRDATRGGVVARELVRGEWSEDKKAINGWLDREFSVSPQRGAKAIRTFGREVQKIYDKLTPMTRKLLASWAIDQRDKGRPIDIDTFIPGYTKTKRRVNKATKEVSSWFGGGAEVPTVETAPKQPTPAPAVATAITETATSPEVQTASATTGTAIATQIVSETSTALSAADFSSVITSLSSGISGADMSAVKNAGVSIGNTVISGIQTMNNETNAALLSPSISGVIGAAAALVDASGFGYGLGAEFVQGFAAGVSSRSISIDGAFDAIAAEIEPGSPPKKGMLKNLDKWGEGVGKVWADGVRRGINNNTNKMFREGSVGKGELVHNTKREVLVKLEVSSPDGTANRTKQEDLRRGALEAFALAGLEHYASVG